VSLIGHVSACCSACCTASPRVRVAVRVALHHRVSLIGHVSDSLYSVTERTATAYLI